MATVEPKDIAHDSKNFESHLGAKVEADSPEGKWEGSEIEVKSDPMIDAGTGKPIVLRVFEFAINPAMPMKVRPTNQDLLNAHAKQIRHHLWKDGLIIREDVDPRVQMSRHERKYRIFVTCEARFGQMWMDKPQTIQEITKR